jgi:tRNA-dihydrouridine synthase B
VGTVREHVALQVEHRRRQNPDEDLGTSERLAIRELRKHLLWYTRGKRGGVFFRRDAARLQTGDDVARLLDEHFPAGGDAFLADPDAPREEAFE